MRPFLLPPTLAARYHVSAYDDFDADLCPSAAGISSNCAQMLQMMRP